MHRIALKDKQADTSKATLWTQMRSALRIRKLQRDDGATDIIGISGSPRQYHDIEGVQEVKSPKRGSHPAREGKLLKQSRVQLRRRLKLLTISEDEEFDDGRHEC